jgi:hypothetical protein
MPCRTTCRSNMSGNRAEAIAAVGEDSELEESDQ